MSLGMPLFHIPFDIKQRGDIDNPRLSWRRFQHEPSELGMKHRKPIYAVWFSSDLKCKELHIPRLVSVLRDILTSTQRREDIGLP
jgi:hypothetical protein